MVKHLCPVCNKYYFERRSNDKNDCCYLKCRVCGWVDDSLLELEPDYGGGELGISLIQAKEGYKIGRKLPVAYQFLLTNCPNCGQKLKDFPYNDKCTFCGWQDSMK